MTSRFAVGSVASVVAGCIWGATLGAQAPRSVASGVYTADQAKRGQAVYAEACAKCHLDDLSGGTSSPPLVGDDFLGGWKGKTVGALFDELRMTMPFDGPGSLKPEQYADLIAYMFSMNKLPAGDKELEHELAPLQEIQIEK